MRLSPPVLLSAGERVLGVDGYLVLVGIAVDDMLNQNEAIDFFLFITNLLVGKECE